MIPMLLVLDAGNTSISLGLFRGEKLVRRGHFSTHKTNYKKELTRWCRGVKAVVICSVVPKATVSLKKTFRSISIPVFVAGENIKIPIINKYRVPSQVGQDRLVNAVAACERYGAPAIIADFGTGLTIDLVSKKREYLGGLIIPGINLALEALTHRAALLPKITLTPPKEFLGRDTKSSMRSGIFYGYGAICDGIVARLKKQTPRAKVIATGGQARLIKPFCKSIQSVDPDLTLYGLFYTYQASF